MVLLFLSNVTVKHLQPSSYKRHKRMEKCAYEEWKTSVVASNSEIKEKGIEGFRLTSFHNTKFNIKVGKSNCFYLLFQFLASVPGRLASTFWRKYERPRSWRLYKRHIGCKRHMQHVVIGRLWSKLKLGAKKLSIIHWLILVSPEILLVYLFCHWCSANHLHVPSWNRFTSKDFCFPCIWQCTELQTLLSIR